MVSNRLIEPLSEWALIDWSYRTALPELLDIRITKSAKDRLYRTSDDLMAMRKDIESTLRERDLFSLSRSVILYDVTNSHFKGLCASNPKAKYGKNKQHRNDCRQVAVGIAFDEHGFPLAHETFECNMGDTKTLPLILDRLARHEQGLKPVPVITSTTTSNGKVGLPYSLQIVATPTPTPCAMTGLPEGLTLNTATGLISGIPAKIGTFTLKFSAIHANGTGSPIHTLYISAP